MSPSPDYQVRILIIINKLVRTEEEKKLYEEWKRSINTVKPNTFRVSDR